MEEDAFSQDICRVCRCEGTSDRPLFHPCICTGSIKFIHQDCLVQWLRYSHKEYCELCSHRFSFMPIYSPDMPKRLPIADVITGLARSMATAIRFWLHYTLVAIAWLGIVPLTACRIYRCLFTGTVSSLFALPLDLLSMENIVSDIFHGCFVVTCTLSAFISLVWLREQILHGGGPDWLEQEAENELEPIADIVVPAVEDNANPPPLLPRTEEAVPPNNAPVQEEARGVGEQGDAMLPPPVPLIPPAEIAIEEGNIRGIAGGMGIESPEAVGLPPVVGGAVGQAAPVMDPMPNAPVQAPNNDRHAVIPGAGQQFHEGGQNQLAPHRDENGHRQGELDLLEERPVGIIANNNNIDGGGVADEVNWNPMEWDRAGEELTWERLLGLDGSLVFLEHVFWLVSLNTLFILVFAFCPYHIGHLTVTELSLSEMVEASHFDGILTALFGYCVVGILLVILHSVAAFVNMNRSKRFLGLCYVVVKVALLAVVEIGVFPLVGGWWLDICSLALFDASFKDRETHFRVTPGTFMFIHWLVGMVYVFYFASFILLLREVLRPGVLWFLRNLNDPDFNPVHEMIQLPIFRHTRRFLASMVIFGSTVLLMLWLPIRIIHYLWPTFLPYHVALSSETPASELSLELILLQVILPALLEQSHMREWLKVLIRQWCIGLSYMLGLRSYLLGDVPLNSQAGEIIGGEEKRDGGNNPHGNLVDRDGNGQPVMPEGAQEQIGAAAAAGLLPQRNLIPVGEVEPRPAVDDVNNVEGLGQGLGAAHQALLQRDGPTGFQAYVRPSWFGLRILGLVIAMCISLTVVSVVCLTLPVFVGRKVAALVLGDVKVHELYTGACGLYICLFAIRMLTLVVSWFGLGWSQVLGNLKSWALMGGKAVIALTVVAIVIPLIVGILMELIIMIPLRVPLHQTPILFLWQDWALGVLYTKIICAIVMMGPDWWLKTHLEQIYLGGLRNLDLHLVIEQTALPVIATLGSCLALPFVIAKSFAPFFTEEVNLLAVERRIYPALLVMSGFVTFCIMQVMQFTKLYEHIKNDKYLVGKRLVNYNHSHGQQRRVISDTHSSETVQPEADNE